MTDREWKVLVRDIARQPRINKRELEIATYYLWCAPNAWDRLKDTTYGKFVRECDSLIPDLLLRAAYRKAVLDSGEPK